MLQQTRIEAVIRYYTRFMQALPTIFDLANCPEETLLKLWEGLGYYNRARNLSRAAQTIVQQYQGILPDQYELLLQLPGFGPYTAGAVASICYDRSVPAVDGNVLRVLARLTGDDRNVLDASVRKERTAALGRILPKRGSGVFNQAVMELGETLCKASGKTDCGACPLQDLCSAAESGRQEELPVRLKQTKRKQQQITVLIIRDESHMLIRKRPERGLLAGLFEPVCLTGRQDEETVLEYVRELGLSVDEIQSLPEAKHIFTHLEWHMTGWLIQTADLSHISKRDNGAVFAASLNELQHAYPIPGAYSAYARWMKITIGAKRFQDGERI